MQGNHKELICTFKEVLSVEAALEHQIITAVDAKYITVSRDRNTYFIKNKINVILKNLFNNYGKITPHMLTQWEDVVKQMDFDVEAQIDTFSMTLRNWDILLPQLLIPTPTSSIST